MHPHPGFFLHLYTRIHKYPNSPATTGRRIIPPCRNVAFPRTTFPPFYVFLSDFQILFKKNVSCYSPLVSVLWFGCIDLDDRDTPLPLQDSAYIFFLNINTTTYLFKQSCPYDTITLFMFLLLVITIVTLLIIPFIIMFMNI